MSIDVEAVDDVGTDDGPAYLLYGGKGGVGKTTMAAASGIASAAAGVDTLVVSTDPAHSLGDVFDAVIGADPTVVRDGLWAVEIDPDAAMEEAALFDEDGGLGLGGLGDLLGEDAGVTVPGADEAAAVQQLLRFLDDDRFDRVIVDTAPTGHTLRLLELPDVMDSMAGRLLTLRERLSGVLDGIAGAFGGGTEDDSDGMADLTAARERIERLRATLRDPARTDFRVVTVPESMSVREADRLLDRLDAYGIPVATIVVNRVMEPLDGAAVDVDAEFAAPDLEDCAFCRARWGVQQTALEEAYDLFRGHDVRRVPLLPDAVRGPGALRVIAACLAE